MMLFAQATEPVVYQPSAEIVIYQALIAAVVTIILAWMQQRTKASMEKTAGEVAHKAEEVRHTLEESTQKTNGKLDGLEKVTHDTHDLVNSGLLAQLRLYATAARRLANLTGDPDDLEAAVEAEKLFKRHERKQDIIDMRDAKEARAAEVGTDTAAGRDASKLDALRADVARVPQETAEKVMEKLAADESTKKDEGAS